jgi:pteridine reductase
MEPPGLDADERKARVEATLVKQADDPQAVVRTVQYLIENTFVTGVCLPVDGGRSIFAAPSGQ